MLKETLIEIFERDLNQLIQELNLYEDESNLWVIKSNIGNSAGNLSLHLIGNLNHFIGATLGSTDYLRNRDEEFLLKNISRSAIVSNIEKTIIIVKNTIEKLSAADFEKDFPLVYNERILSIRHMLIHLLSHLAYHLGQINYHRRLVDL